MPARIVPSVFSILLFGLTFTPGFAQTATPGRGTGPPADVIDRLKLARVTGQDATKLLGNPRTAKDGLYEYSMGGYLFRITVSSDQKPGIPPGVVLGIAVEIERPRRVRDLPPLLLNGYWTPKSCDESGQCAFELGSFNPLHVAKLKDLSLDKRCSPALFKDGLVVRYTCAGNKANNAIDVAVEADLKYGLEGDLANRAQRAQLMLKVRQVENDPNNPDRGGARTTRQQFGIVGTITNETIWNLVKDLPVTMYSVFTSQPASGGSADKLRTATSVATGS